MLRREGKSPILTRGRWRFGGSNSPDLTRSVRLHIALANGVLQDRVQRRQVLLHRREAEGLGGVVAVLPVQQRRLERPHMALRDRLHREIAAVGLGEAPKRRLPLQPRLRWWLALGVPAVEQDGQRRVVVAAVVLRVPLEQAEEHRAVALGQHTLAPVFFL